jgi:hypothetical protein
MFPLHYYVVHSVNYLNGEGLVKMCLFLFLIDTVIIHIYEVWHDVFITCNVITHGHIYHLRNVQF